MRLGLAHAIDRQAIVDKVTSAMAQLPREPSLQCSNGRITANLQPIPLDKDKCLSLLKEEGWEPGSNGILQKDGEPLKFTLSVDKGNPAREQTATIIQQMLKDVGCDVTLETRDWGFFSTERWLAEHLRCDAHVVDYPTRSGSVGLLRL